MYSLNEKLSEDISYQYILCISQSKIGHIKEKCLISKYNSLNWRDCSLCVSFFFSETVKIDDFCPL